MELINAAYAEGELPIAFFVREDSYDRLIALLKKSHGLFLNELPDVDDEFDISMSEFKELPIIADDRIFEDVPNGKKVTLLLKTIPLQSKMNLEDILNPQEPPQEEGDALESDRDPV